MKHIVSISGGVGSYFTLKRVLEKANKDDVIPVFMDTLAEDGDLYRFLDDIEKKLDIKIIRLCNGNTPLGLAFDKKFLWNSRIASCSIELKSKPFRAWLNENYKADECILYLGIDWTETHRCEAIRRNYEPYRVEFPMCEKPWIDKDEMIENLKVEGIEIPRLYKLGFAHNNCKGCCVKAGIGQYRNLLLKDRITYLEFENKEEEFRNKYNKDVSILKRKGKVFTLRELRRIIENEGQQLSLFDIEPLTQEECNDIGGCSCFIGDEKEDVKHREI